MSTPVVDPPQPAAAATVVGDQSAVVVAAVDEPTHIVTFHHDPTNEPHDTHADEQPSSSSSSTQPSSTIPPPAPASVSSSAGEPTVIAPTTSSPTTTIIDNGETHETNTTPTAATATMAATTTADGVIPITAEITAAGLHWQPKDHCIPSSPEHPHGVNNDALDDQRYHRARDAFVHTLSIAMTKGFATPKSKDQSQQQQQHHNASPLSSPRSGAPVAKDDQRLLTAKPNRPPSEVGAIPVPHLLTAREYKHGVATMTREQWAVTAADKAVEMLLDINSPVGEADMALWTDAQLKHLVDTIEPVQWPIMIKKSGAFGAHVNGVDITFKNLFYRKNNTQRLNGISGYIKAGSMVAVVGAPDAGITTFFDVLTNRQRGGVVNGEILINGRERDSSFDRLVGYITKEDIHQPILTVKETLMFSAQLRADGFDKSKRALSTRTDIVLKMLNLRGPANTIVGDGTLRGISGGEKRRTSIGVELVAAHPVLVADLPTNGLDSATAFDIMRTFKFACQSGSSVIASLSQPSPELLNLFDTVMVLSKGSCIYFGPRAEAIPYFEAIGFPCPPDKQYPDFIEELSAIPHRFYAVANRQYAATPMNGDGHGNGGLVGKQPSENNIIVATMMNGGVGVQPPPTPTSPAGLTLEVAVTGLIAAYRASEAYENVAHTLFGDLAPEAISKAHILTTSDNHRYNSSLLRQIWITVGRQFTLLARSATALRASVIMMTLAALVIGSLYWQIGDSQKDARTKFGVVFYVLDFTIVCTNALIPVSMLQRNLFYPQKHRGYFKALAYYIAQALAIIPITVLETFIMAIIVYPMIGFRGDTFISEHWWYYFCMLLMFALTAKSYQMSMAAVMPSLAAGMAGSPIVLVLFILGSGFLAPRKSLPNGWRWLNTISFESYAIKGTAINEMFDTTWTCNPWETLVPELDSCQLTDGHSALNLYDMDADSESEKWSLLLTEFYFYLIFNGLAWLGFQFLDWSQTDTSELPNWNQQDVKRKKASSSPPPVPVAADEPVPVPVTASPAVVLPVDMTKPPPVYISWNNLSYVVDVPIRKADLKAAAAAPAGGHGGRPSAASSAAAPVSPEGHDAKVVEMAELKGGVSVADEEQVTADAPGKRTLLHGVYGYAKPGMVVALMGGSGAGKTTLLDVLAGKKTGGYITNDALINGKPRDKSFNRIAGYVEQFDSHDNLATVREAVVFSAMLRLPSSISYEDKIARVNEVLQKLRLSHVQHQRIGGVSPEIRKKVTIAVELVMNPGLLFLDEPTTGLDSAGALAVMHAVKSLSTSITVICTIHQPSIEIVNCFSHVLLMNKWEQRGRVAFFGEVKSMPLWFNEHHLGQFQEGHNIAEFGLEALQIATKAKVNVASMFLQSDEGRTIINDITTGINTKTSGDRQYSTYATGFINQVMQTTKRFFWSTGRNRALLMARYGITSGVSLLTGLLLFNQAFTQKGATNRVAIAFISSRMPIFSSMSVIAPMHLQRPVYFREKNSQMYSPLAYYWGRVIGEQPWCILESICVSLIVYWMTGLRSDDTGSHFGWYLFGWYLTRSMGTGFMESVVALTPTAEAATKFASSLGFSCGQLFAGYLIRESSIPRGWIWMHYLSLFKYPIQFYSINELKDLTFGCPDNLDATNLALPATTNFSALVARSNGVITCQGADGGLPCYACPITTGDAALNTYDFDPNDRFLMLGCIIIMMVGYRFTSYYSLRYKNWISK